MALSGKHANARSNSRAEIIAFLLFCYPVRNQVTEGHICHCLHVHGCKEGHMGHFSSLLNKNQSVLTVYNRSYATAPQLILMSSSDEMTVFEDHRMALEQMYLKMMPKIVVFAPNCRET
jgi:hypothetical protein